MARKKRAAMKQAASTEMSSDSASASQATSASSTSIPKKSKPSKSAEEIEETRRKAEEAARDTEFKQLLINIVRSHRPIFDSTCRSAVTPGLADEHWESAVAEIRLIEGFEETTGT